jgi:hypothetical protein
MVANLYPSSHQERKSRRFRSREAAALLIARQAKLSRRANRYALAATQASCTKSLRDTCCGRAPGLTGTPEGMQLAGAALLF